MVPSIRKDGMGWFARDWRGRWTSTLNPMFALACAAHVEAAWAVLGWWRERH